MNAECNFRTELWNIDKSFGKFYSRDLEIRRACNYCRIDMDQNNCVLFQIYGKRTSKLELKKFLEEIDDIKKEIVHLQGDINELQNQKENKEKEIIDLNDEIEALNNKAIKIRANDFLRSTIGEENYLFFKSNGYLDILGTNNSTYRITNDGKISKIKTEKRFIKRIIELIFPVYYYQKIKMEMWKGKIKFYEYPLEDAIAIVYMNIIKDSDRFDKDKGCGVIYFS